MLLIHQTSVNLLRWGVCKEPTDSKTVSAIMPPNNRAALFLGMWDLIHPLHSTPVKRLVLLYDHLSVLYVQHRVLLPRSLLVSLPNSEWMNVSPSLNLWCDLSFLLWPEPRDKLRSVDVMVHSVMYVCLCGCSLRLFSHIWTSIKQDVRVGWQNMFACLCCCSNYKNIDFKVFCYSADVLMCSRHWRDFFEGEQAFVLIRLRAVQCNTQGVKMSLGLLTVNVAHYVFRDAQIWLI